MIIMTMILEVLVLFLVAGILLVYLRVPSPSQRRRGHLAREVRGQVFTLCEQLTQSKAQATTRLKDKANPPSKMGLSVYDRKKCIETMEHNISTQPFQIDDLHTTPEEVTQERPVQNSQRRKLVIKPREKETLPVKEPPKANPGSKAANLNTCSLFESKVSKP